MNLAGIITIAWVYFVLCAVSAIIIVFDIVNHPQRMRIMNVVWPLTALYSGPLAIAAYFNIGRNLPNENMHSAKPMWQSVLAGVLHCGSGCALGDLIAASLVTFLSIKLFTRQLINEWAIEYAAAFAVGIIFQFYAIKPMKDLSAKDALVAALKADALSLTFWQIGMYSWMAIADFLIFHHLLKATSPVFWLMMQIGMLCGLLTAYPINWWLIKKGIKEKM
jgi:hypothetical protein